MPYSSRALFANILASPYAMVSDSGPVQIPKGKVISKRWRILRKLGEGGCGAVYKVEDLQTKKEAALKAESNFVSGGSVLKLEVQVLRRLKNKPYVTQLLHSGKRESYSYMVMTLLGESLRHITKRLGKVFSVSTQVRIGINVLFSLKQIHDVGFVHRDIKPANMAIGRIGTPEYRFIHILDFGLAREFVVHSPEGKLKMRRPRPRALFRGTTRYCSVSTHEKAEQGRMDDLWCLLYMLAELRGPLPWANASDKREVYEIKRRTDIDVVLENCPVQLIKFAEHLSTLNYYMRPDYLLLYELLVDVMRAGKFRYSDPYDWEIRGKKEEHKESFEKKRGAWSASSTEGAKPSQSISAEGQNATTTKQSETMIYQLITESNPFPQEFFALNALGF
nr:Serine threonine protein kinase-related domain containing protein [Haemonchus contortus]